MERAASPSFTLVGHERVLKTLAHATTSDTVHHAYLFEGVQGIGKSETAAWLARALLCVNRRTLDAVDLKAAGELACGECAACSSLLRGQHPDLLEIAPPEGSKQIKVDQVRELIQKIRYAPLRGQRRVVFLYHADRMGDVAANALLKTLEEPATYNVFVLLTDRPQSLLPTILSRCQRVRFSPLSRKLVTEALVGGGAEPSRAHVLAVASGGSMGMAYTLEEAGFIQASNQWLERYLNPNSPMAADPRDAISDAADLGQAFRKDSHPVTSGFGMLRTAMLLGIRDIILHISGGDLSQLTWPDREEVTVDLGKRIPLARLIRLVERLQDAEQLFVRPLNPTLVVEDVLLRLVTTVRR